MSYQQGTGQTSCHPHWFLHQAPETSSGALNPLQKAQQLGSRPMLETNLTRYSTVKTCAPPCSLRISSNFFSYAFWKNIAKNKYGSGSQFTSLEMKRYFSPSKLKRRYPILQVSWFCKLMQILQVSPTIYIYKYHVILMSSLTSCQGHAACITVTWGWSRCSLKWMGSPCAQHLVLSTHGTEWCTPSGKEAMRTLACKKDRSMIICSLTTTATTTCINLGNWLLPSRHHGGSAWLFEPLYRKNSCAQRNYTFMKATSLWLLWKWSYSPSMFEERTYQGSYKLGNIYAFSTKGRLYYKIGQVATTSELILTYIHLHTQMRILSREISKAHAKTHQTLRSTWRVFKTLVEFHYWLVIRNEYNDLSYLSYNPY